MCMTSVERIVEYASIESEKLLPELSSPKNHTSAAPHPPPAPVPLSSIPSPRERDGDIEMQPLPMPLVMAAADVPADWPRYGEVVYQSVCLKYPSDERYILKYVNIG